MEEIEPKKRFKIINKEFLAKYAYVFVLAVLLIGGISYSYTFFTQNRKIASGSITTANLTINFTDRSINATNLSVPSSDKEGLVEYAKEVTITNQTNIDGRVKLTLTRTSGLTLNDLRYALVINGAIQEINDVPTNGEILSSAIMGSEVINVEIRLWPKTTYTGSTTTFVGELTPEIKYLGSKATTSINSPAGKYVNFNCSSTCEVWQIVKVEDDRLVLTRQSDYSGSTSRTNSNKYDSSLTFNDNSMITSVSTDGKNVYLARTVKIDGGNGTQADPYVLINNDFREKDKKIIAQITYKDDNANTVGTQNVYYNETNYISQIATGAFEFVGWSNTNGGTVDYEFGDTFNGTVDQNLYVVSKRTLYSTIKSNADTTTLINFGSISSSINGQGLYRLPGTESNTYPIYYYRGAINNNNVIFGGYCWQIVRTTDTGGIKMIYNGAVTGNGETCENTAHADRVLANNSAYSSQYNTLADVGYMKNARYTYTNAAGESNSIYGKNVEWDGSNYLVIEDTSNTASTNETKDNYHHYSCGTAGTTSCSSVRYYYYNNYYITLTNGEKVEDAIYKMTGNGDATVKARNSSYVLNQNNSTIKTMIENWFETNMTNVIDSSKTDYRAYIEDEIYCNDRSFQTIASGSSPTYLESGWNPNGGNLTNVIYFGTTNRALNNWYSTSNVPSTVCPNETDSFSLINSVAHLNYSVGLLTADEIIMAGASGNSNVTNNTYYLYTGGNYWSLSTYYYNGSSVIGFYVGNNGLNNGNIVGSQGVRPVISLKHGTEFETGGDGTPTNPYVVDYNSIPTS